MSVENITKEKYEYLFLDIEWNQAPGTTDIDGREPVQIAIMATDEELHEVKTFLKAVRLSDPTILAKNTIRISHVSPKNVMNGKTKEEVMKGIRTSFPAFNNVVVWTRGENMYRPICTMQSMMRIICISYIVNVIGDIQRRL